LKADHRQVEVWFEQFEKARDDDRKQTLATKICGALQVRTTIEEEIFYPAFLEATDDKDLHHEAEVEHDAAKKLIEEIEAIGPDDDYYDAKVKVLSEIIKHHVKEEEQPGGMFAEAHKSEMDLQELGETIRMSMPCRRRTRAANSALAFGPRARSSVMASRYGKVPKKKATRKK
jgi:hypothetical protein